MILAIVEACKQRNKEQSQNLGKSNIEEKKINVEDELKKMTKLRDEGIITQEELNTFIKSHSYR